MSKAMLKAVNDRCGIEEADVKIVLESFTDVVVDDIKRCHKCNIKDAMVINAKSWSSSEAQI